MIFLAVLLIILFLCINYLFFAPFYIEIDSRSGIYRFRFHKLVSVYFFVDKNPSLLLIKILAWKKEIDLSKISGTKNDNNKKQPKQKSVFQVKKLWSVLKSFSIKECYITVDSGNMALNGILYPIIYLLSVKTRKNITINFTGNTIVNIRIKNNLARITRAYLRS